MKKNVSLLGVMSVVFSIICVLAPIIGLIAEHKKTKIPEKTPVHTGEVVRLHKN